MVTKAEIVDTHRKWGCSGFVPSAALSSDRPRNVRAPLILVLAARWKRRQEHLAKILWRQASGLNSLWLKRHTVTHDGEGDASELASDDDQGSGC
jgi:hypothetical protein